jgi:pimeloyl-ACP methyl ester carboxylesterase
MKNRRALISTICTAVITLVGLNPTVAALQSATIANYQSQKLNWKSCGADLECTTVKVPVDYASIDGKDFVLAVTRHLASDKKNRIGTLFVNPGGPGGSAFSYAQAASQIVSKQIVQRYDILGFDPRGVGKSEPTRCLTDKEEDRYISADTAVIAKNDLNTLLGAAKYFASACAKKVGSKIGHYGSLEAAKDMNLIRTLLREPKLNFLGKSYGTFLGTLYAALYPTKVGKFVLDGAIDPNATNAQMNLTQAIGFETALLDYSRKTNAYSQSDIVSFLNSLRQKPLKLPNDRVLTPSIAIIAIASTLYENTSGWPNLTKALDAAIKRSDARPLFDLADAYNMRDANGHYSTENDMAQIISCLDLAEPRTVAEMTAEGIILKKKAPVFGPYLTYAGLTCKYWKHAASKKPSMTMIKTAPVVVIGVTKDPATPYAWAQKLAKIFTNSALITFSGEGHTGHNRGSSCVDNRVDSYLLGGSAGSNLSC